MSRGNQTRYDAAFAQGCCIARPMDTGVESPKGLSNRIGRFGQLGCGGCQRVDWRWPCIAGCGTASQPATIAIGGGPFAAVTFTVGKSCARYCIVVEIALYTCLLPLAERSIESTWHPLSLRPDWLGIIGLDSHTGGAPLQHMIGSPIFGRHVKGKVALCSGVDIVDC